MELLNCVVAYEPDVAERWAKGEGKDVILLRPETRPDDVHGMLASKGVVTSKGGRTSHAALVARHPEVAKARVIATRTASTPLDAK